MVPFVSAHQVQVTLEDLRIILSEANPLTTSLSQLAQTSVQQHCKYNEHCALHSDIGVIIQVVEWDL